MGFGWSMCFKVYDKNVKKKKKKKLYEKINFVDYFYIV